MLASPLISIIVPVYNVEKYIRKCIESIVSQIYNDWELLLIDDGSQDISGEICDEYSLKDKRIKVFHQKNNGVSSARNLGIKHALGEWITFIDADDFIGESFIQGLFIPIIQNKDIDFVHGGCMNFENGSVTTINQNYTYYIGSDKEKLFLSFRGLIISKLFKTNIIHKNNIFFDKNIKIAEDMEFTLHYLLYVNKYAFVPEYSYYYRRDSQNSTTKNVILDFNQQKYIFEKLYEITIKYISQNNISHNSAFLRYKQRANQYFSMICSIYYNQNLNQNKRLYILNEESKLERFQLLNYLDSKFLLKLLINKRIKLFDVLMKSRIILYKIRNKIKIIIK